MQHMAKLNAVGLASDNLAQALSFICQYFLQTTNRPHIPAPYVLFLLRVVIVLQACLASWSPDKDLLAIACRDQHVLLYRLNWQRLWSSIAGKHAIAAR